MRLRPTLRVPLTVPREEGIELVRSRVAQVVPANNWLGKGRWCEIHLPAGEQRIWSPHLSLRLDHEDEGSSIFVRFAPRPEVWTLFVFAYTLLAFGVLFSATLGYVQWASDESAWGLTVSGLSFVGIAVLYLVSWVGQRLSMDQTDTLIGQLEEVIGGLPTAGPSPFPARESTVAGDSPSRPEPPRPEPPTSG